MSSPTLRLTRLTLQEIRLPLVEPFHTAHGTVDVRRVLLARLEGADGLTAWSECVAEDRPGYSPDTVDSCWLALTEWTAPLALSTPVESAASLHAVLQRAIRGHQMARATVEMGMWALESLREGLPLAALLARSAGVDAQAYVSTGIALGFHESPESLAAQVRAAEVAGYRRIKIKIEPGRDLGWVDAARAALCGNTALSVDANCAYSLDDTAHVATLQRLDARGLAMIEQPLAHDDFVRHAELQRLLRTPICLDEGIRDAASVATMIALGAGRMVNVKPARVGGLAEALAIRALCAGAEMPLWCGGMLETGVGRAYNVALAALPGFTEPGDLSPSARYWARDIVSPPWTMDREGRVRVPLEHPGLGVQVDEDMIDDLTVRRVTMHAA